MCHRCMVEVWVDTATKFYAGGKIPHRLFQHMAQASLVPRLLVGGAYQEPGYEARFRHS